MFLLILLGRTRQSDAESFAPYGHMSHVLINRNIRFWQGGYYKPVPVGLSFFVLHVTHSRFYFFIYPILKRAQIMKH